MIGKILQGYRIVDKIKDGSVGTVWRAVDNNNKKFALKQIHEHKAVQRRKLKIFRREAALTKSLKHPNIIKVYDYVDVLPRPFFVMELFESENLKYCINHDPGLILTNEFTILRQIAEALSYIHSKGIIHKDVKPENVLLNKSCDVRLIDFSLAKSRWRSFFQFGRKSEGTPSYMAPEQVLGKVCDERADIYSFGVLMYELLSKKLPFMASTEKALLEKILQEKPASMRSHVNTISPDLDDFCRKLLTKNRANRIQDMAVVISELIKWERKGTIIRRAQVRPDQSQKPSASR